MAMQRHKLALKIPNKNSVNARSRQWVLFLSYPLQFIPDGIRHDLQTIRIQFLDEAQHRL